MTAFVRLTENLYVRTSLINVISKWGDSTSFGKEPPTVAIWYGTNVDYKNEPSMKLTFNTTEEQNSRYRYLIAACNKK